MISAYLLGMDWIFRIWACVLLEGMVPIIDPNKGHSGLGCVED
jgi:hypothetical protein